MKKPIRILSADRRGDLQNKMNVTLMMILLAFFIVLNTLAVVAPTKKKAALGSLIGTLGILPGGPSPMMGKKKDVYRVAEPMLEREIDVAALVGEFEDYMIRKEIGEHAATIITTSGLQLILRANTLFEPGSARFIPSAIPIVEKIGAVIAIVPGECVIEGRTASRKPPAGRYRTDIDLSAARAGTVAQYFMKEQIVQPQKVSIAGYGALKPLFETEGVPENIAANDNLRIIYRIAI